MADDSAPSTAVATREAQHALTPAVPGVMSDDDIQRTYRVASALAASGIFKDVKSAEQAFGKLVVGRSLGLTEAQSLSLYAMEGKIEAPYPLLANFIRSRPGYDYRPAWIKTEGEGRVTVYCDEDSAADLREIVGASIEFTVDGVLRGVSSWTVDDTARAELEKNRGSAKSNHVKYPRNMYLARAISNGTKWFVPEVLGGLSIYAEGEIERTPNLAAGEGSGEEPGWGSVPIAAVHEVEKIIRRAVKLGHAGLQSRAAIQMMLSGQPDETVQRWINEASRELDALQMQPEPLTDAQRAREQVERGEKPEPDYSTPQEQGTPQPEGVDDDGSQMTDEVRAERAAADEALDRVSGLPPVDLPPQTQLALAEARVGAARNDREEREARAEVERLRGEAT